jgi:predicted small lipoprotein YifL
MRDDPDNMNILVSLMRAALLILLLAGPGFGCGQRGELYLRDSQPSGVNSEQRGVRGPATAAQPVGEPSDAEKKR